MGQKQIGSDIPVDLDKKHLANKSKSAFVKSVHFATHGIFGNSLIPFYYADFSVPGWAPFYIEKSFGRAKT